MARDANFVDFRWGIPEFVIKGKHGSMCGGEYFEERLKDLSRRGSPTLSNVLVSLLCTCFLFWLL